LPRAVDGDSDRRSAAVHREPANTKETKMSRNQAIQLLVALGIGVVIMLLPRPEGRKFRIVGDPGQVLYRDIRSDYVVVPDSVTPKQYIVEAREGVVPPSDTVAALREAAAVLEELEGVRVEYVDGLSPKGKRFLVVLGVLVFLFLMEPIPLEITAILIGVFLVVMGVADVREAWAPYMHPVVLFIMCCLIFAIALDKAGLTKRLGYFIVRKAGTDLVRFTFIVSIGLGYASMFMHDAAAVAIGLVTMIPLMKAAGVKPGSNTAKFMTLALPFACSSGGMGSLIGGGRCMVAAAFLKEFTGIEIDFFDWIKFAAPGALFTVPAAVFVVYFFYRPDPSLKLPRFEEEIGPWSRKEIGSLVIIGITFLLWLTKGIHGLDYSITGMLGVATLVGFGILQWDDIHEHLEWGTALFIFGGGISLGLAMGGSGAADYFAYLFFPYVKGGGWLLLFAGVGVFGALVTNAMANVAAAALILPIVIPMAQLEGVDPRVLALWLGMATSFAMLLVIGCPPNAIAYSYRYFKSSDLTKVGLVATPVLLGILILVAGVWWKILGLV
jgi:solute carrier family 13 (sodium-dependent dicarboxylate transporter), member 2/3/5